MRVQTCRLHKANGFGRVLQKRPCSLISCYFSALSHASSRQRSSTFALRLRNSAKSANYPISTASTMRLERSRRSMCTSAPTDSGEDCVKHDFSFLSAIFSRDPGAGIDKAWFGRKTKGATYDLIVLNMPSTASDSSAVASRMEPQSADSEHLSLCDFPPAWRSAADDSGSAPLRQSHSRGSDLFRMCLSAERVLAADGGANVLHRVVRSRVPTDATLSSLVPVAVVGDLDSVRPEVLQYFESKGTRRELVADQNMTDFEKTLRYAFATYKQTQEEETEELEDDNVHYIIGWGAFGGRLDHEMQAFNVLRKFSEWTVESGFSSALDKDKVEKSATGEGLLQKQKKREKLKKEVRLILMSSYNFAVLLPPGRHRIGCSQLIQGPTCGLVPMFRSVTVSASGLQWDLQKQELKFGGLVSTSNRLLDYDSLRVQNDHNLVFYTSVRIPHCQDDAAKDPYPPTEWGW